MLLSVNIQNGDRIQDGGIKTIPGPKQLSLQGTINTKTEKIMKNTYNLGSFQPINIF
jgi:hypothetical protein